MESHTHTHTNKIDQLRTKQQAKKKTESNNKKNHFRKSALFLPSRHSERDLGALVLACQAQKWTSWCVANASQINNRQSAVLLPVFLQLPNVWPIPCPNSHKTFQFYAIYPPARPSQLAIALRLIHFRSNAKDFPMMKATLQNIKKER